MASRGKAAALTAALTASHTSLRLPQNFESACAEPIRSSSISARLAGSVSRRVMKHSAAIVAPVRSRMGAAMQSRNVLVMVAHPLRKREAHSEIEHGNGKSDSALVKSFVEQTIEIRHDPVRLESCADLYAGWKKRQKSL